MEGLCYPRRTRHVGDLRARLPPWAGRLLMKKRAVKSWTCALAKVKEHLYGKEYLDSIDACREKLNSIEVDRLRVKPIVKITGEFWAQITEGDGNFHMFEFLEREGAQVIVEPIATWVAYLMYQAKAHATAKWPVNRPHRNPKWYE